MAIISKACKPDNFELHNSLKLSFTNIRGIRLNFVDCESFLESNSLEILALCETSLDDSNDSSNFSVRGYLIRRIRVLICMVLQFMLKKHFLLHVTCLNSLSVRLLSLSVLLLFPLSITFFIFVHGF